MNESREAVVGWALILAAMSVVAATLNLTIIQSGEAWFAVLLGLAVSAAVLVAYRPRKDTR